MGHYSAADVRKEETDEDWMKHRMWVIETIEELKEIVKDQQKEIIALRLKLVGIGVLTGSAASTVFELVKILVENHKP